MVKRAADLSESTAQLFLRSFGIPDLDVVEEAVFAGNAEFDLGLGGVSNSGRLEKSSRLAVDRDAHFIADGFNNEDIPLTGFKLGGISNTATDKQLGDFSLLGRIIAHFSDVVFHAAIAFVDDGDTVESDLSAAEMTVVGSGVFAVIELYVDHRSPFETNLDLDDTVLGGNLQTMHRRMGGDGGLAISSRNLLVPGLGAFQRAVFDREGGDHLVPDFGWLGSLKVIGEEDFFFPGDRLGWDGGHGGKDSSGDEEEGS